MDTVTHAVIGALVLRLPPSDYFDGSRCSERVRYSTVIAASVFPDLDYAGFLIDPYRFITEWHRGISHSLLMLPVWAVVLGLLSACLIGRSAPRLELVGLCALGLLLHNLFDLITVYGTQIFAPWSDFRIALGVTFDADIWIAAIAAIALSLSFYRRFFAKAGVLFLGLYLGVALVTEIIAIRLGETKGSEPVEKIYAIAHPLSVFHRSLVVETNSGYWVSRVNLSGSGQSTFAKAPTGFMSFGQYRARQSLDWTWIARPETSGPGLKVVQEVWREPEMEPFRRFAALPALYRIDSERSPGCVWFTDLRYVIPGFQPPFRYGMCRKNRASGWQLYRLKRFTDSERELLG